jgi:predicted regulator of Ras-like GTPase activity (Roadblock/LC7/MglB family)
VNVTQALDELTEISSQIAQAAVFRPDGSVEASTLPPHAAGVFADAARRLLETANEDREVAQLEAATAEGSVFVVREGERLIAATTGPEPTVGLVFYDLKSCLRTVAAGELEQNGPKRRRRKKADAQGD